MDTLTHALSGALLARATAPAAPRPDQLTTNGRMAIGFVAAAFPDSDFIARWIDPLTYLTTHRGITHSILLLPLWALALASCSCGCREASVTGGHSSACAPSVSASISWVM